MLNGVNILVVEDEALIALDLSLALEDEGAVVAGPFATVDTALPCCDRSVDAAVLDVDLCGIQSFPIADRLRQAGIPFVFHTGRADLGVLRQRYGDAVPIIEKPSMGADIIAAIAKVLH